MATRHNPEVTLAERLRSERARRGMSRESLAHLSGVSFAAIAQIEGGRRKDIRLSSVVALARALAISVDRLVDAPAPGPLLEHLALPYASDDEILAALMPFIAEGLERDEPIFVAASAPTCALIRASMPDATSAVTFTDADRWYTTPEATLDRFRRCIDDGVAAGSGWVRIIGEPVWTERLPAEIDMWVRYEALINLALAECPATVVCLYDTGALAADVSATAYHTHPQFCRAHERIDNPVFMPERVLLGRTGWQPGSAGDH